MELTQTQLTCFLHFSDKDISDISLHTRVGSLPTSLLLLFSWQQEYLFQVKNDKMSFLNSLESTALSWLSLVSTLHLPLVIGSCFLATDLVWPTKKEVVSSKELTEVWLTMSHVQLCLEQCGNQGIRLLLVLGYPCALLLSQPFCFGTAEQSRAQGFYYSRASLLSLHVRVVEVYLESQTRGSKVNKRRAVNSSYQKN